MTLTNALLFCPTRFEVPKHFRDQTHVFGMGPHHAKNLAIRLNKDLAENKKFAIVFGSAGSLNPRIQIGDVCLVDSIFDSEQERFTQLETPFAEETLSHLCRVKLFSSDHLLSTSQEKKSLHDRIGADLVDMEMSFILKCLEPNLRQRILFIRVVIDGPEDEIDFIEGGTIAVSRLLSWKRFRNFLKFLKNYRIYLQSIDATLKKFN